MSIENSDTVAEIPTEMSKIHRTTERVKEIIRKSFDLSTVAELKFTKVNGEERTMTILAPDAWPDGVKSSVKPPRKVAENIVHVYEKGVGFKSFRSEDFISCVPVYLELD